MRENRPTSPSALRDLGLRLRELKPEGLFREVYQINSANVIVKFPKGLDGREHTRNEIRKLLRLRKFSVLRDHLPRLYYYDSTHAVVVMEHYPRFERDGSITREENQILAMGKLISKLITRVTKIHVTDIHDDNVHSNRGDAVIIDWGY